MITMGGIRRKARDLQRTIDKIERIADAEHSLMNVGLERFGVKKALRMMEMEQDRREAIKRRKRLYLRLMALITVNC